jgi:hypothetical protein
MQSLPTRLSCLLAIVLACGSCHRTNGPKMAPVRGRVLLAGKPLGGATVTFIARGAPRFSTGTTDAEGNFSLTTFTPNDGAVIGQNTVTVTVIVRPPEATGVAPDPVLTSHLVRDVKPGGSAKQLPLRYADARTSGLTVTVGTGKNSPVLELQEQ